MSEDRISELQKEIKGLHKSVARLKGLFESKKDGFTLDGRLVGDIGEVVAEELFQIKLYEKLEKYYDAATTYEPKRKVQIKATFKKHLTYNHSPDYYIGIKLFENGDFKVMYNGPGKYIHEAYKHRKHIGKKLLLFPISRLAEISSKIEDSEKILVKEGYQNKMNEG